MKNLINFLMSRGLISPSGVNEREISSYNLQKFVDLNIELERIIEEGHNPIKNNIFSHSASLGLGGSSLECSSVHCRLERINKLARFALMYSDKVVISSFFSGYKNITDKNHLNRSLNNFYNDLIVLFEIRGAISNGLIQFFSPKTNVCFACQAKRILGKQAASRFSSSYSILQNEFLDNMNVTCKKRQDGYGYTCNGPSPYFDHGIVNMRHVLHKEILKRPTILENIEKGNVVNISKTLVKKIELHKVCAHHVATNAIYGLSTSKCLNTNFLTENELHLSLLNSLQSDEKIQNKNLMALNHITSIVPFIDDVNINNIIKLRKRENESFIIYRNALLKSMNEVVKASGSFTEKDAKALYSDVIAPSLASLDQKVKKSKKDLISKPLRSLTGVVGAISFGLLTGIIPADISSLASAIGLAKFGTDFIKDVMATGDKEDAIQDQQFYFLWKVKKKSNN